MLYAERCRTRLRDCEYIRAQGDLAASTSRELVTISTRLSPYILPLFSRVSGTATWCVCVCFDATLRSSTLRVQLYAPMSSASLELFRFFSDSIPVNIYIYIYIYICLGSIYTLIGLVYYRPIYETCCPTCDLDYMTPLSVVEARDLE